MTYNGRRIGSMGVPLTGLQFTPQSDERWLSWSTHDRHGANATEHAVIWSNYELFAR
jgi:hypothetical protein